jgi:hypothetical protein
MLPVEAGMPLWALYFLSFIRQSYRVGFFFVFGLFDDNLKTACDGGMAALLQLCDEPEGGIFQVTVW